MIQIPVCVRRTGRDDAGYGSLIEGCAIGAYRVETGEFVHKLMPVKYFQHPNFKGGEYLDAAIEVVKELLANLNVPENEPIQICRGWIFTRVKGWLSHQGYKWNEIRVENPLQSLIETTFRKRLNDLGIDIKENTPPGQHFYLCLKWLKGGNINGRALAEREALAKSGWDSYHIWAYLPYQEAKKKAAEAKRAKKAAWIRP